jgi:hypothetical protein
MMLNRRFFVAGLSVLAAGLASPFSVRAEAPAIAEAPAVEVWKSPSCGCCGGWIKHMQASGFVVTVHDVADVDPIKRMAGVPNRLHSCHTAKIDGYVLEGHVPAADVRRLLAERPAARGLSVPGMPQSAPGMDNPGQPYEVVLFGPDRADAVYARH